MKKEATVSVHYVKGEVKREDIIIKSLPGEIFCYKYDFLPCN